MFLLGKASPFDPVAAYFGVRILRASPEQLAQIRADWGVDDPAWVQYWRWLANLLSGDLGDSRLFNQPVSTVVGERLGWSVLLVVVGLAVALGVAWSRGPSRRGAAVAGSTGRSQRSPTRWKRHRCSGWRSAALSVFAVDAAVAAGRRAHRPRRRAVGRAGRRASAAARVGARGGAGAVVPAVRAAVAAAGTVRRTTCSAPGRAGCAERTVVLRHALRTGLLPLITLIGARVPGTDHRGAARGDGVLVARRRLGHGRGRADGRLPAARALTLLATVAVLAGQPARRRPLHGRRSAGAGRWLSSPPMAAGPGGAGPPPGRDDQRRASCGCGRPRSCSACSALAVLVVPPVVDLDQQRGRPAGGDAGAVVRASRSAPTRSAATSCCAASTGCGSRFTVGLVAARCPP